MAYYARFRSHPNVHLPMCKNPAGAQRQSHAETVVLPSNSSENHKTFHGLEGPFSNPQPAEEQRGEGEGEGGAEMAPAVFL